MLPVCHKGKRMQTGPALRESALCSGAKGFTRVPGPGGPCGVGAPPHTHVNPVRRFSDGTNRACPARGCGRHARPGRGGRTPRLFTSPARARRTLNSEELIPRPARPPSEAPRGRDRQAPSPRGGLRAAAPTSDASEMRTAVEKPHRNPFLNQSRPEQKQPRSAWRLSYLNLNLIYPRASGNGAF